MNDTPSDTPLTNRQRYWLEHLQAWRAEGGSLTDYARAHDLRVKALYYWRGRERELLGEAVDKPLDQPSFSRVEVVADTPVEVCEDRPLKVSWPNGARMEWPAGVSTDQLAILVSALRQPV